VKRHPRALTIALSVTLAVTLSSTVVGCDELTSSLGGGGGDDFSDGRTNSAATLVTSLPSKDAVRAAYNQSATTPEGAVKVWLTVVMMATSGNLSEHLRGRELLTELTPDLQGDPSPWWERTSTDRFVERINTKAYIFGSYAVGATPANGYALDPNGWQLNVESSAQDGYGRGWRVSIRSGGADTSRPVYLQQIDGLWYIDEFANVYVDIRPPE